jgi:hypothetical protein
MAYQLFNRNFSFIFILASFTCIGFRPIVPHSCQKQGSLSFTFKNKEYKTGVVLLKTSTGTGYTINTGSMAQNNSIAIVLPDIATGRYPFSTGNDQSNMFINGNNYLLNDGYINIEAKGKVLSGNFKAKYYSSNGKGGYNKIPAGEINGTFDQLIIQ